MKRWLLLGLLALPVAAAAQSFNPTFNAPGATVGTTSAIVLAAGSYNHVQIQNTSASANIACRWGGTAALNSITSVQLSPGQPASWGPVTGGVPGVALYCIASAAGATLYLETN